MELKIAPGIEAEMELVISGLIHLYIKPKPRCGFDANGAGKRTWWGGLAGIGTRRSNILNFGAPS